MKDLIRVWNDGGFILAMYDTGRQDWRGKTNIAYKLWDTGKLIFSGEDFSGSALDADDSDQAVASLLGFLSLQYGDTDREYFDSYTPAQLDWMQGQRCSDLKLYQSDMEESRNR